MRNISKIKSDFYLFNSDIQKKVAKNILLDFEYVFLNLNKSQCNINILEIGSGGGNLTFLIIKKIIHLANDYNFCVDYTITEPNENFYQFLKNKIDKLRRCLLRKNIKNINISLYRKDFESFYNSVNKSQFDITLSNFVYHWIGNFYDLFQKYYHFSKFHIFSIPINDSFREFKEVLNKNDINFTLKKQLPCEQDFYLLKSKIEQHQKGHSISIKKRNISKKFNNIFDILKFFRNSGFVIDETINLGNIDIDALKKIKKLNCKCKMEFVYLHITTSSFQKLV